MHASHHTDVRHERVLLATLAACCVVPMIVIVGLTSVLGFAIGSAAAIAIGVVAAGACIAVMTARHRSHRASTDAGHERAA